MADRIMMNGILIKQPLSGLGYSFEKRYSNDSTYTQSGNKYTTTVGVYEKFQYTAADLTEEEISAILHQIIDGEVFILHYRSPYYGEWRDGNFQVDSASAVVGNWIEDKEVYESLSFTMTGVNPLD